MSPAVQGQGNPAWKAHFPSHTTKQTALVKIPTSPSITHPALALSPLPRKQGNSLQYRLGNRVSLGTRPLRLHSNRNKFHPVFDLSLLFYKYYTSALKHTAIPCTGLWSWPHIRTSTLRPAPALSRPRIQYRKKHISQRALVLSTSLHKHDIVDLWHLYRLITIKPCHKYFR